MARVTVFFHGLYREKIGKDRVHLTAKTISELITKLRAIYPEIEQDIRFNKVICLVNGRNLETLAEGQPELEDFDLVSITLRDGGHIDFFPPDGGG